MTRETYMQWRKLVSDTYFDVLVRMHPETDPEFIRKELKEVASELPTPCDGMKFCREFLINPALQKEISAWLKFEEVGVRLLEAKSMGELTFEVVKDRLVERGQGTPEGHDALLELSVVAAQEKLQEQAA